MPETQELTLLEGYEEAGSDFTSQDISLPYLRIVQALSPIMRRTDPKYNPQAREGMILNTLSGRLTDKIDVVVAKYIRRVTEWKPNRGAFVRDHGANIEAFENLPDTGLPIRFNSNGNEFHVSGTYFVLDVTEETPQMALLDMSATHMKASRRWNGLLQSQEGIIGGVRKRLPIFARVWTLSTIGESNDKGSWSAWKFDLGPLVTSLPNATDLIGMATNFRANAATMALPPVMVEDQRSERPAPSHPADEDVPF